MDIPITNPNLSASLEDNSKVDDSFKQEGTTVNLGSGATYNQNCGNQREFTRLMSTILILLISFLCDAFIVVILWMGNSSLMGKFDKFEQSQKRMEERHNEVIRKADAVHDDMLKKAKEGTIWLLRDDIIKSIDFHEATKKITQKQYRRLKDEFDYYTSIGGNHDVKERFDDFVAKIFGIGEIKMLSSDVVNTTKVEK